MRRADIRSQAHIDAFESLYGNICVRRYFERSGEFSNLSSMEFLFLEDSVALKTVRDVVKILGR